MQGHAEARERTGLVHLVPAAPPRACEEECGVHDGVAGEGDGDAARARDEAEENGATRACDEAEEDDATRACDEAEEQDAEDRERDEADT